MRIKIVFGSVLLINLFIFLTLIVDIRYLYAALICMLSGFFLGFFRTISIYIGIFILLFIPGELQFIITGLSYSGQTGKINFHLIFFYLLGLLLSRVIIRNNLAKKYPYVKKFMLIYILFIFYELLFEFSGLRGNGLSNYFVDIYITPILMFIVILYIVESKKDLNNISNYFLLCLTFVGIIGVIEQISHQSLVIYHEAYLHETNWYNNMLISMKYVSIYRNTTTLGHFLINATYFMAGILLSLNLFYETQKKIYLVIISLFLFNIVFTYSRAAILLLVILVTITIFKNIQVKKISSIIAITVICLLSFVFFDQIIYQFIIKPLNATDSSFMVRIDSLKMLFSDALNFSLIGSGPYTAQNLRSNMPGISTGYNFEIGWLISLLEIGVINFTLYVTAIFFVIKHSYFNNFRKNISIYLIPVIGIVLMFATYNSFGNRSSVNCLLWLIISFMVASKRYSYDD